MGYIIGLLLLFVLIIGFYEKTITTPYLKRKNISFGMIAIVVFIILLMGGNLNNPDSYIYESIYNRTRIYVKDIGFGYYTEIAQFLGLDLNWFRLVIAIIGIMMIQATVARYLNVRYQKLFYILYIIYPFFLDIVQVRNFVGLSIFIFAFPFLFGERRRDKIIYIGLVLLAGTMHKLFFIYLSLVFLKNVSKNKLLKFIIFIAAISTLLFSLDQSFAIKISQILSEEVSDSLAGLEGYLKDGVNIGGYSRWFHTIINILVTYFCTNVMQKYDKENSHASIKLRKDVIEYLFWANCCCIIVFPLYLIDVTFFRITRNLQVLNWLGVAMVCQTQKETCEKERWKGYSLYLRVTVIFLIMFSFYYYYIRTNYVTTIILNTFQNNWIL